MNQKVWKMEIEKILMFCVCAIHRKVQGQANPLKEIISF